MHRGAVIAVLVAAVAAPSPALAQQDILNDYRRDGTIDPCAYSPGELQQGLENLPPDIEQYAPDLADQLRRGAACAAPAPAPAEQPVAELPPAPVAETPAEAAAPPPKVPDPPAPEPQPIAQLAGAAPAAATVPTTRAAEEDFPTGILIAAALALAAGATATRLRRT
jgi:hypothetical protein